MNRPNNEGASYYCPEIDQRERHAQLKNVTAIILFSFSSYRAPQQGRGPPILPTGVEQGLKNKSPSKGLKKKKIKINDEFMFTVRGQKSQAKIFVCDSVAL